jgi:SH3 domain-containing YSC84-like protein 1
MVRSIKLKLRLASFPFLPVNRKDKELIVIAEVIRQRKISRVRVACQSLALLFLGMPVFVSAQKGEHEQERVKASGDVMKELLNSPSGVPISVLNKSECVIILPSVKKAGFIVAGSYGRGVMTCRSGENFDGHWSSPTMMQSSGGSFGLQAGGQATDFVILVMNDKGARAVMNGKAKLGADASVAAGPVGRAAEASTNASMSAEMLSYSRAQGVFAGVSLSGTSLGPDNGANENLYGKKVTATQIIGGNGVTTPDSAKDLLAILEEKSPKNESRGKP